MQFIHQSLSASCSTLEWCAKIKLKPQCGHVVFKTSLNSLEFAVRTKLCFLRSEKTVLSSLITCTDPQSYMEMEELALFLFGSLTGGTVAEQPFCSKLHWPMHLRIQLTFTLWLTGWLDLI